MADSDLGTWRNASDENKLATAAILVVELDEIGEFSELPHETLYPLAPRAVALSACIDDKRELSDTRNVRMAARTCVWGGEIDE